MLDDGLLGLAFLGLALTTLLLAVLVDGALAWQRKLFAVVACFGALWLGWMGLRDLLGQPTHEALPEASQVLAAHVEQPDKRRGRAGAILLWVIESRADDPSSAPPAVPRAHRLPYDLDLHRRLTRAQAAMQDGDRLMARTTPGRRAASERPGATAPGATSVQFERSRARRLPPKDH